MVISGNIISITSFIMFIITIGGLSSAYADTLEWDQDMYMIEHSGILTLTLDNPTSDPGPITARVGLDECPTTLCFPLPISLTKTNDTTFSSQFVEFTNSPSGPNRLHITPSGDDEGITATAEFQDVSFTAPSTVSQLNLKFLEDYSSDYRTKKSSFSVITDPCDESDPDTDGDGLCDSWETNTGLHVNTGGAQTYSLGCTEGIDYDQSPLGIDVCPNSNIPDIYFEIDSLVGHAPSEVALKQVVNAFRFSNYEVNGQVVGINIHIQLDETNLPHVDLLPNPGSHRPDKAGTDQLKKYHYGTLTERGGVPNVLAEWNSDERNLKNQAFHYVIFAHDRTEDPGSSGFSEYPGNDIMISLGSWEGLVGSPDTQAGTLLHEIGHNLDLDHGGKGDDTNCKPNYVSVMSFSRQTSDLVEREVDFSQMRLNDISASGTQHVDSYGNQDVEVVYGDNSGNPVSITIQSGIGADIGPSDTLHNLPNVGCGTADGGAILEGKFDYEDLEFVSWSHANWKDGVSVFDPLMVSEDDDMSMENMQPESAEPEDVIGEIPDISPNGIPTDVCVKHGSKWKGIMSPNPAFDRICITDELNISHAIEMRDSRVSILENEIESIPDDHFVNPSQASAYKKEYIMQLDNIRDSIKDKNMQSAINQTKIFQSWFDGEGEKEYITNEASREKMRNIASEVVRSQLKTVPEFESVALIILSISIITVIAITSKSKLSLTRINQ